MKKLLLSILGCAAFIGANAAEFTVYNNGSYGENIHDYGWNNVTYNPQATSPTNDEEKVLSFMAADNGANASFGLELQPPGNTGYLNSANLTFQWYAEGTGTYQVKLNAGISNEQVYTFATVDSSNAGTWQTAILNIPQIFDNVAQGWKDNSNLGTGYVFSAILTEGSAGDIIYFKDIKYTDIDTSWEAPAPPTPDVTYPDGTNFVVWPQSIATGEDVYISSDFYMWGGQSTAMNENGTEFMRFTGEGGWYGGGYLTAATFNISTITSGNYDLVFDVRVSSPDVLFRLKVDNQTSTGVSKSAYEKEFSVPAYGEWTQMRVNLPANFANQLNSYEFGDRFYIFCPVANPAPNGTLTGSYIDFKNVRVEPYQAPDAVAAGTTYYGSVSTTTPAECTFEYKAVVNENQTVTFYVNIPQRDDLPGAATPSLSIDGDWKDLAPSNDSEYAWERTSESTFVKGQIIPCFFYQPYTGNALRADFNYTFGSSNEKPAGPTEPDQPGDETGNTWTGTTTGTLENCQINGETTNLDVTYNYAITYNADKTLTIDLSVDPDMFLQVTGISPQLFIENAYKGNFIPSNARSVGYTFTTSDMYEAGQTLSMYIYSAYANAASSSTPFSYTVGSSDQSAGEPTASLEGEDVTLDVSSKNPTAEAEFNVTLTANPEFDYSGFQFDITLPEYISLSGVSSEVFLNISKSDSPKEGNVYTVVAFDNEKNVNATGTIATLTVSTDYSSWNSLPQEDLEMTISKIFFSTENGVDIEYVTGCTNTITVQTSEIPVEKFELESVTLMEPSYTTEEKVESITVGESLGITFIYGPDGADFNEANLKVTINEVEGLEYSVGENGAIIINTEDVAKDIQDTQVTVSVQYGDITPAVEHTFTITKVILGDSNDSGVVTVADVVTTANYIAYEPIKEGDPEAVPDVTRFDFPNANVIETPGEKDEINTADLEATIAIALGEEISESDRTSSAYNAKRRAGLYNTTDCIVAENFSVKAGKESVIGVSLASSRDYTSLQATAVIPEGMKVIGVTTGAAAAGHELVYNIGSSKVGIVLYSLNGTPLSCEGAIFNLVVAAQEDAANLTFDNVKASDRGFNTYILTSEGGRNVTGTTGIEGIDADEEGCRYFDLRGIEIPRPDKGIYIRVNANGEAVKVVK